MAKIYIDDSMTGRNEGLFQIVETDTVFSWSANGTKMTRTSGGDYLGGGLITKRKFPLVPGFFVQVSFRRTDSAGALFSFVTISVYQRFFDGGVDGGYGFGVATTEMSSFGTSSSSGQTILNPMVLDQFYTLKYIFEKDNLGAYAFNIYVDGVLSGSQGYDAAAGSPRIGDDVAIVIAAPFYPANRAVEYKDLLIQGPGSSESTSDYDTQNKELYV